MGKQIKTWMIGHKKWWISVSAALLLAIGFGVWFHLHSPVAQLVITAPTEGPIELKVLHTMQLGVESYRRDGTLIPAEELQKYDLVWSASNDHLSVDENGMVKASFPSGWGPFYTNVSVTAKNGVGARPVAIMVDDSITYRATVDELREAKTEDSF